MSLPSASLRFSRLPDRGPQHYIDHLHSSRRIIEGNQGDPALHSKDLEVLNSILLQGRLLAVFDWQMAGYGIPAPDIAELSGRGIPRRITGSLPDSELADYWEVVRASWQYLDLPAVQELAELG